MYRFISTCSVECCWHCRDETVYHKWNTNFGGASTKIYTCYERKTAFVMQNFRNLGVGVNFFDKTPKWHILAWFRAFWAIDHANRFTGFFSRRAHDKKGHYKKSQREYISPICGEFPTQPSQSVSQCAVAELWRRRQSRLLPPVFLSSS